VTAVDPYLDPVSGVLRNLQGITDEAILAEIEADVSALRMTELEVSPLPGLFDLAHLCRFHKAIFGDLYDWAGTLRTVEVSKGPAPFCLVAHLDRYAATIFETLQNAELSGDRATAATQLALHLSDINALHPFREGNGRAQRSFIRSWSAQFAGESTGNS
jgi:cell filamentation protein